MQKFRLVWRDGQAGTEVVEADDAQTSRDGRWVIFTVRHPVLPTRRITIYKAWSEHLVTVEHVPDPTAADAG